MKTIALMVTVFVLIVSGVAQTAPAKKSAGGPTKVTGTPTKTASGLEYWDIKAGTGAVAQAVGGKGGGRPDMAEAGGKDATALPAALAQVYASVEGML